MIFKINEKGFNSKEYCVEFLIDEKDSKFKCEHCWKKMYSKKVVGQCDSEKGTFCLKCVVEYYTKYPKNKILKEIEKIKEKYAVDLVALEL